MARRVLIPALLATLLAACNSGGAGSSTPAGDATWLGNPGELPVPTAAGNTVPLPDLTVDHDMLAGSLTMGQENRPSDDCAVVEGCLNGPGTRNVLRFDVGVMNIGAIDLHMGAPEEHPGDFEYSSCHQHYHYKGFAKYELTDPTGTVVATGAKRAFCLMDINDWGTPNPHSGNSLFDCGDQGIHVGWEDVYDQSLDCQWLDVTDVPAGDYKLSVTVNAEGRILEQGNAENNTVTVPVTLN